MSEINRIINRPIGYNALIKLFNLSVIPHFRSSYVTTHGRGFIRIDNHQETHIYPKSYELKDPDNPLSQIEFALKYDGMNLEILEAVFKKIKPHEIETAIQKHPASKYIRIIWFLYEFLIETKLNIRDSDRLSYVDVLDPKRYFTAQGIRNKRQYVNNNLLGPSSFCPLIRKTIILNEYIEKHYDEKARTLSEKYDPQIIERASHYLYTKETLSSYEIEREKPSPDRMARFIKLLQKAYSIEILNKKELIALQNIIVDPRFRDVDYRYQQNYVGENINHYIQRIHYISPKPEDVELLMNGLFESLKKMQHAKVHPVLIATAISFGFVFIHPFEDGNGRIHRFLIHHILSKEKFTPPGIIFPVSAVMLQNIREYDNILERFSKPLLELITQYHLSNDGALSVNQVTMNFYKYIDYSHMAEYLFTCISKTLHEHFEKEIHFLINYDRTKKKIQSVIDMPDKLIDLFIKFVVQNHGSLGEQKRIKYFIKLNTDEIERLQSIVKKFMINNENEHK